MEALEAPLLTTMSFGSHFCLEHLSKMADSLILAGWASYLAGLAG